MITSSASLCIPTSDTFPLFSLIRFHCNEGFNYSFDAEFYTLKACVIWLERIDFETVENSQIKRASVLICIPTLDIFPVFSLIQIHCKETFDNSFGAVFNALQICVILLERFDFKTVENSKSKDQVFWFGFEPQIFFQFFPSFKFIAKKHSIIHSMQHFLLYKPV